MTPFITHHGGCHCGAVRFSVQAPAVLDVLECTCSICRMSAFLHLIVPLNRFQLLQGQDSLTEYRFNTGVARHFFCKTCGMKPFYVPRSNPDGMDVNVRCFDIGTVRDIKVSVFDDAQREAHTAAIAHLSA